MFGFSSIGPFELLLILVVALVIFGPRKLPEIGKAIGQAIRSFKEQSQRLTDELTLDIPADSPRADAPPASTPPPERAKPAEPQALRPPERAARVRAKRKA